MNKVILAEILKQIFAFLNWFRGRPSNDHRELIRDKEESFSKLNQAQSSEAKRESATAISDLLHRSTSSDNDGVRDP